MVNINERISEIEKEIARTQKNKATEHHIGLLKARLAKLRSEQIEASQDSGGKGAGFDVARVGNARVALIGFPSVGKSTLLSSLTKSKSEVAAYEFTTLTCIPGVLEYKDIKIQLLDLPGIIEGASQGIGRGKQVIAVARTADLVLVMLDALNGHKQLPLLITELETCGIRLNKTKPDVYFKKYIMPNLSYVKILVKVGFIIVSDELIDILIGNRIYIPALYVYNKIDRMPIVDIDKIASQPHAIVISCNYKLNFDYLLEKIWEYLSLLRIYTKRPGEFPALTEPLIMKTGSSVREAGRSVKYNPQRVGLTHILSDEDVIQIAKN